MSETSLLQRGIQQIFVQRLNLSVPSVNTNLLVTGALDSLSFVNLLVELERRYGIQVSFEDLELQNFQTIATIADFVAERLQRRPHPAATAVAESP